MTKDSPHVVVIGAGIGGLSAAALLAKSGYRVTVLEAQTYPGGCASTFYHQGYRFDSGATLAGGFQPGGPHQIIGNQLGIEWPVRPTEVAWQVHLPGQTVTLTSDYGDLLHQFPHTRAFWEQQATIADIAWQLSARGLPWPPTGPAELLQLAKVGLAGFPRDLNVLPYTWRSVQGWLKQHKLDSDPVFKRFVDAQLLISAQTTSEDANALYGATALDLARQGVQHVEGGIGRLAETLVKAIRALGGEVHYRHRVKQIVVEQGRATGVLAFRGRHDNTGTLIPADFIVANMTPWSLEEVLGEASPWRLQRETAQRAAGWGAFVLHLGIAAAALPQAIPYHHQIITALEGPLGEGRSIFVSMSPEWDSSRAPAGKRAATITTHTRVQPWWDLLATDEAAYHARKSAYAEQILTAIDQAVPGFRESVDLCLPGSPVTYAFYTDRHLGMVGGFPQISLFKARGPRTGIPNLRLVGDSIFPGQSTAGVTIGAMRVARDVERALSRRRERPSGRQLLTEIPSS